MNRKISILLCASMLALSSAGCSTSAPEPAAPAGTGAETTADAGADTGAGDTSDIHLALIAPITGDDAQYGLAFKTGITVKIDEINAAGGIGGKRKIVLDIFDDKNEAKESTTAAQLVTGNDKYIAAIGCFSSTATLAAAPIFDEAKMPLLVPCAGHADIAVVNQYTFQRGVTIPVESAMMARYSVTKLGGKRIAFISLNNDAGLLFKQGTTAEIERLRTEEGLDCETVAAETFNSGEVRDFSPLLIKIKNQNPDVIVMNLQYTDCAAILLQAEQLGLDATWYANQSMYNTDFTDLAGDAANGLYISTGFFADNPDEGVQEFVNACVAADGKIPSAYQRNSYECTAMVIDALEKGATTREELFDALCAIEYWDGKTGGNTWKDRQVSEEYLILQYHGDGDWSIAELAETE